MRSLELLVRRRYTDFEHGLPFHGWHHIEFVRAQAAELAAENGADSFLVASAALVHDLNYMVERNSRAIEGSELRRTTLEAAAFSDTEVELIEEIVLDAETSSRGASLSLEAQALSDADTLFKALPVTPVMLAHRYMEETGQSLSELCDEILRFQLPLLDEGIYFYNARCRELYSRWARVNLELWESIRESLQSRPVAILVQELEADPGERQ